MKPKTVEPASKVGALNIFGVSAAVGPNLQIKTTSTERGSFAVEPKRVTNEPAILTSNIDNESIFVNLEVFSSPGLTICDTGASVSCISQ